MGNTGAVGGKLLGGAIVIVLMVAAFMLFFINPDLWPVAKKAPVSVEKDSLYHSSGLVRDAGLQMVVAHCTGCHSAKLITQNRSSREGWSKVIKWMQATQGLWDLGESEDLILDYLAKNYPPEQSGRRRNLSEIQWYKLEQN